MAASDTHLARQVSVKDFLPGPETLRGMIPLQSLERIRQMLNQASDDELGVELSFERDLSGTVWLAFDISAALPVECQRCLQGMIWKSRLQGKWVLSSRSDLDADSLELEDGKLDLWNAVEDELILSYPLAPMHEHQCVEGSDSNNEEVDGDSPSGTRKPFAGLDKLLGLQDVSDE